MTTPDRRPIYRDWIQGRISDDDYIAYLQRELEYAETRRPEVAASADESRYRWARQQTPDRLLDLYMNIPGTATPEQFDAEIDAAIQASSRMNSVPPK